MNNFPNVLSILRATQDLSKNEVIHIGVENHIALFPTEFAKETHIPVVRNLLLISIASLLSGFLFFKK
jgi:hypothetical protein